MVKIHIWGRETRPRPRQTEKKSRKLLYIVLTLAIIFIFFRVQALTILFFIVGFIV